MVEEIKIEELRQKLLDQLDEMTDQQFWDWVASWYDGEAIIGIVKSWDNEGLLRHEIENTWKVLEGITW